MPKQLWYGYDKVNPFLDGIRLVTQLANATATEFRQKNAQTPTSTLRPGWFKTPIVGMPVQRQ